MSAHDLRPFGDYEWWSTETDVRLPSGRRAIRVCYRRRGSEERAVARSFLFTPADPGPGSHEAIERAIAEHASR